MENNRFFNDIEHHIQIVKKYLYDELGRHYDDTELAHEAYQSILWLEKHLKTD